MLIPGSWTLCPDGVTRPFIRVGIVKADGALHPEDFLVDSGADRTVFTATTLAYLGNLPTTGPAPGVGLAAVGGTSPAAKRNTSSRN